MTLKYVNIFAQELPYALREQVIGYARSVDLAAAEIFVEADIELNEELRDQLTLIAAVKKLYAICSSSFWILHNSTELLGGDLPTIRVGQSQFGRNSNVYGQLSVLLDDLTGSLHEHGVTEDVLRQTYPAILEFLVNGR